MALLGGLSAAEFMRRHWQKKPLLVRAACPDALPDVDRSRLFALAARDDVESRLVVRAGARWSVRPGPIARRALPTLATPAWTLLVQGVDLHDERRIGCCGASASSPTRASTTSCARTPATAAASARTSIRTTSSCCRRAGRRRWRIGRAAKARLRDDVPLKMLADFVPSEEWLLEPGDMLYLPPGWGHDGVAVGECITASIGFRAPRARELAADVAQRLAEAARDDADAVGATGRAIATPARRRRIGRRAFPSRCSASPTAALERLLADRVAHVARARRGAERAQARHLVRARGRRRRAGADDRARPPHPHALRRALRLRQRRGVSRRRTRCDTDAPARRPAPARRRAASPARASRPASCSPSG